VRRRRGGGSSDGTEECPLGLFLVPVVLLPGIAGELVEVVLPTWSSCTGGARPAIHLHVREVSLLSFCLMDGEAVCDLVEVWRVEQILLCGGKNPSCDGIFNYLPLLAKVN
jgi:hypothetical protein